MLREKAVFSRYLSVVLLLIIFLAGTTSYAGEEQDNHFYFVQISDTHFGGGAHFGITEKVVAGINELPIKIECVIHTGDIMADNIEDNALVQRGRQILQQLTTPLHFLPGNHDIDPRNIESTLEVYRKSFGGLLSQAEYHGVVFIFIYTEPLHRKVIVEGYDPLRQLEERLKKSSGKPVIIFHHSPSVENFYNNKFHRGWEKEIRAKWVRLVNAYNVKAVIAGHFHRDEHHWIGDVPLYISSSIAGYWGRQATFRIYEYRNGKIGYRTQYIE